MDDDEFNILVLKEILKQIKFSKAVDHCYNGLESLNKITESSSGTCNCQYKFILMDVNMPVLGGIEATKRII